jgi:hypothetical protein
MMNCSQQNPSILKPASNHQVCTVYVLYIQWFMIQHNPISTLFSFWLQKIGTPLSGLQRGPGLAMQGQQCPTLLFHSDCCSCGPLSTPTVHMIHLTRSPFWLLSKNQLRYSLIQWGVSAGVGPPWYCTVCLHTKSIISFHLWCLLRGKCLNWTKRAMVHWHAKMSSTHNELK